MAQATFLWQLKQWPRFNVQEAALRSALSSARQEQGKVMGLARAIGMADFAHVAQDIWVDEALATAAIEGEKLDLAAVRSSVLRRLGLPGGGPLPASRSVDGLLDVMQDGMATAGTALDDDRLWRWQGALFPAGTSGIHRIAVGRYRDSQEPMQVVSGPIGRETLHYEAPSAAVVPQEMRRFLDWFNGSKPHAGATASVDGIVRAALCHLWFESVHPFDDGNGRIGRAIVDMALAQDDGSSQRLYGMSRQLMREREAYYSQLEQAQRGSLDVTPWVQWFLDQFRLACVASQQVIEQAVDKSRFWKEHAATAINKRQRKALLKMLEAGNSGFAGGMSASKYGSVTRTSKATATRDLAELERNGLLITSGQGRSTRYWVNIPEWKIALTGTPPSPADPRRRRARTGGSCG